MRSRSLLAPLLPLLLLLTSHAACNRDPELIQREAAAPPATRTLALQAGGAGADGAAALAVDAAGNVLVGGTFTDRLTIGDKEHTATGGKDVFVAKFTAGGVPLWSVAFGSAANDQLTALVVDARNDVYVAGSFVDAIDLGGGPLTGAGGSDLFVARLDGAGAHVWSRALGGPGLDADARLALDAAGDVLVAASFSDTLEVAGKTLASAGFTDIAVVRLSGATGAPADGNAFGGAGNEAVGALAVGPGGDAVLAGTFDAALPSAGGAALEPVGDDDVFVLRLPGAAGRSP